MTSGRSTATAGAGCTWQRTVKFSVAGNSARTTRMEELVHVVHNSVPFHYLAKPKDRSVVFQVVAVLK
jgi:hypothetical protein